MTLLISNIRPFISMFMSKYVFKVKKKKRKENTIENWKKRELLVDHILTIKIVELDVNHIINNGFLINNYK